MTAKNKDTSEQGKTWMCTINNYTDKDIMWLNNLEVNRMVASKEIGEQGTPHIQAKMTFKQKYRLTALKKLNPRVHWDLSYAKDEWNYCKKIDSEIIIDKTGRTESNSHKKSGLEEAVEAIQQGASIDDLYESHPKQMVVFGRGLKDLVNHRDIEKNISEYPPRWPVIPKDKLKSVIFWGESGIGKTKYAKAHFTNPLFVTHTEDLKKLTKEHDGIIFDDMNFTNLSREVQIHISDYENPRTINVKHEAIRIPKHTPKIFTTNIDKGEIFDLSDKAISRRLEIIRIQ